MQSCLIVTTLYVGVVNPAPSAVKHVQHLTMEFLTGAEPTKIFLIKSTHIPLDASKRYLLVKRHSDKKHCKCANVMCFGNLSFFHVGQQSEYKVFLPYPSKRLGFVIVLILDCWIRSV